MKAYLLTTGTLFGLLAALHAWRAVAEWEHLASDSGLMLETVGVGLLALALCVWAWRLVRGRAGS
jgi:hypothetical protein